jgi:nitroreductase
MTDLIEFLQARRSVKPKDMREPGPSPAQIETILKIAARVPDHGKYAPWYFIVFSGETRTQIGLKLEELYLLKYPDANQAQRVHEREKFLRAPVIIAVVSRIREGKNPQWEQILSAGAACYNLCLAANGLGFASNWLTEWYSYDEAFKAYLGVAPTDNIGGFIYLGTASEKPDDRERPDMARIVTHWQPGTPLNTGEGYGQEGAGRPEKGFI